MPAAKPLVRATGSTARFLDEEHEITVTADEAVAYITKHGQVNTRTEPYYELPGCDPDHWGTPWKRSATVSVAGSIEAGEIIQVFPNSRFYVTKHAFETSHHRWGRELLHLDLRHVADEPSMQSKHIMALYRLMLGTREGYVWVAPTADGGLLAMLWEEKDAYEYPPPPAALPSIGAW